MKPEKRSKFVHIVSHGPHCFDGVAAAVAVARYHRGAIVEPHFSGNASINEVLRALRCDPPEPQHEVWITDISWTDPAVDRHLQDLLDRGVQVYWIDHHRTALERCREGEVALQPTAQVLSEDYAASRLTYEFLQNRLTAAGKVNDWFAAFAPIVAMADDNDRWLHRIPGSRELARTIAALSGLDAYRELLHIDANATPTARMREAAERAERELQHSFDIAERSRVVRHIAGSRLTLVSAVCAGYCSDIADAWNQSASHAVFAFFDAKSLTVSLRRSYDCDIDLSHLARGLGGGGHPAAAGCELSELRRHIAEALAAVIAQALAVK